MRMRPKPWAEKELVSNPYVITNLNEKWYNIFNNNNPIYTEIGTGKGKFIIESAINNPKINYVGLERQKSVCAIAAKKIIEAEINNVRILYGDATKINGFFRENEISRIFLNFSDPWPKARTAKRRLTHRNFLNSYKTLMKQNSLIIFKTDNEDFFYFSLNEFKDNGWNVKNVSLDLHGEADATGLSGDTDLLTIIGDNVMTEYEQKFNERGNKIYRIIVEK